MAKASGMQKRGLLEETVFFSGKWWRVIRQHHGWVTLRRKKWFEWTEKKARTTEIF